jgi:hypothetical protein
MAHEAQMRLREGQGGRTGIEPFRVETGVAPPRKSIIAAGCGIPLQAVRKIGDSLFLPVADRNERRFWRGEIERAVRAHTLATGRVFTTRTIRGDRPGIRVWLLFSSSRR